MGGKHEFDSLTHAQPARITVDPDRNTQGDELATDIVYDYYTGLVTSSTDPNGRVVTTSYANQLLPGGVSDPYGRPGVVTDPLGHRTTTRYFDSILKAEISADLNFPWRWKAAAPGERGSAWQGNQIRDKRRRLYLHDLVGQHLSPNG